MARWVVGPATRCGHFGGSASTRASRGGVRRCAAKGTMGTRTFAAGGYRARNSGGARHGLPKGQRAKVQYPPKAVCVAASWRPIPCGAGANGIGCVGRGRGRACGGPGQVKKPAYLFVADSTRFFCYECFFKKYICTCQCGRWVPIPTNQGFPDAAASSRSTRPRLRITSSSNGTVAGSVESVGVQFKMGNSKGISRFKPHNSNQLLHFKRIAGGCDFH